MDISRHNFLPQCITKESDRIKFPFIELDGTFVPCCFLTTSVKKVNLLKEFYGDDYKMLNVNNNSVSEIKKLWDKISDTWETDKPFPTCIEVCSVEQEKQ